MRLLLSEETQGAITVTFKDGDDEHVAKFRWDQVESCEVRADADYITSAGEIPRVVLNFHVPESTLRAVVGERWTTLIRDCRECPISDVALEERSGFGDGPVSYRFADPIASASFECGYEYAQSRRYGEPYAYPTHAFVRFRVVSANVRISLK